MHHQAEPISDAPILVALDLGEHCNECLEHAWRIAAQREQTLIVAHIAHETARTAGRYQQQNRGSIVLPIPEIAKNLLGDFVEAFCTDNPAFRDFDARQVVVSGIPETRIPELAKRYHAGAIVVGHRQRTGLFGLLQKSVGQVVAGTAHCPVVLLNGPDKPASAQSTPAERQRSGLRSALSHMAVRHPSA